MSVTIVIADKFDNARDGFERHTVEPENIDSEARRLLGQWANPDDRIVKTTTWGPLEIPAWFIVTADGEDLDIFAYQLGG
jgi:hypothetical protein